jgi:hypothetical protein
VTHDCEQMQEEINLEVKRCGPKANNRDEWLSIIKGAKVLRRPYSQGVSTNTLHKGAANPFPWPTSEHLTSTQSTHWLGRGSDSSMLVCALYHPPIGSTVGQIDDMCFSRDVYEPKNTLFPSLTRPDWLNSLHPSLLFFDNHSEKDLCDRITSKLSLHLFDTSSLTSFHVW